MIDIAGAPADLHSLLGLDTLVVKKKVMVINSEFNQVDPPSIVFQYYFSPNSVFNLSKQLIRVTGQHYDHNLQIEMVEVVLGCETKNRYHIFDSQVSSAFNVVSHFSLLYLLIIGQRAF